MKSGCSSRQAVHQEAKTLTSPTSPWRSVLDNPSVRPWTGGRAKSGTGLPISAEGSSRGSRVSPQASAMASATKAATGTRNSSRGAFVRGPALGAGETESVTVLPPARVEEEVFDQGRDAEDEHQDDEQPDEAHSPHHAAHAFHHVIRLHRSPAPSRRSRKL